MPKYAILSDIHGNLEALSAVLDVCAAEKVEKFILLGDIVGYNANPSECIHLVRQLNLVAAVKGNHDEYAVKDDMASSGFNESARLAIQWTHDQLSEEDIAWLKELKYSRPVFDKAYPITAVHATMDTPENWGYIFDIQDADAHFMAAPSARLSFCGHSHVPVAFDRSPNTSGDQRAVKRIPEWEGEDIDEDMDIDYTVANMLTVKLEKNHRYLFNIGSIGQPRNGDPRASFAIYDSEAETVSRFRIPYDIATAQQKVRDAGLPERLALRLALGH